MSEYVLTKVDDTDYNGFADVSFFYFSNKQRGKVSPGGHSDRVFRGKTVVMIRGEEDGKDTLVGLAEVSKLSPEGRPTAFGRTRGSWFPPGPEDEILDERGE